ncbi:MAG: hypothetical protein COA97_02805 [Flavobacteriales bacterium]|nr:MAG: hypothetical protein COA97_02805 [Flavobacteriales bacterium]
MSIEFDFKKHKIDAVEQYIKIRPTYERFTSTLRDILEKVLSEKRTNIHSIEARAKDIENFGEKAVKPSEEEPSKPKYPNPLDNITDLAGLRIIAFFPRTVEKIDQIIYDQFDVVEKIDKSEILKKEEKLGYHSVHYLIKLHSNRSDLPEYKPFHNLIAEIQVRTILQHAWAEIEHDIKYKSSITIPENIKRRFISLAGLLEIADREFQSIQDEDNKLRASDRKLVKEGKLEDVAITPDALKTYLDKVMGSDGRISKSSYDFDSEKLIEMGFKNLLQIDTCIKDYIDNSIVETSIWGSRQGQLWRLQDLLLAALGDEFIKRHPWSKNGDKWATNLFSKGLKKMKKGGVKVGKYKTELDN